MGIQASPASVDISVQVSQEVGTAPLDLTYNSTQTQEQHIRVYYVIVNDRQDTVPALLSSKREIGEENVGFIHSGMYFQP